MPQPALPDDAARRGQPLDRLICGGALPLETLIEIATALTGALAAAHEKGIVHRDLELANVVAGEGGSVKLLDFSLAQLSPAGEPARGADGKSSCCPSPT